MTRCRIARSSPLSRGSPLRRVGEAFVARHASVLPGSMVASDGRLEHSRCALFDVVRERHRLACCASATSGGSLKWTLPRLAGP